MATLKELREKFDIEEKALALVFEEAATEDNQLDFKKVKCLGDDVKSSSEVAKKVQAMNAELTETAKEVEALVDAEKALKDQKERQAPQRLPHPGPGNRSSEAIRLKSMGEMISGHPVYEEWRAGNKSATIELPDYGLPELKALFQTTAGWEPESTRTGIMIDAVTRPIQVTDIIPAGNTGMAAVVYMEETTRTHAAAEMNEGAAYAEATFALTEKSVTVRKLGTSIPVTDEQLEDVPMVQGYLDQRLRFGLRQRLDSQILIGDGIAPNITGILNTTGIQTQAKGADPTPDAVYKAKTLVQLIGRAQPNAVVFHPNDWQQIRLLRTSDGIYIWGSPSETGPERIWGLPIVISDALPENTALIGDFANFSQLFERRGIEVKVGLNASDFTTGKQTIRADLRVAFVVFRPAAFATITGI